MKLFNKITLLSIGAAMAIGGGVAALINKKAVSTSAEPEAIDGYDVVTSIDEGDEVFFTYQATNSKTSSTTTQILTSVTDGKLGNVTTYGSTFDDSYPLTVGKVGSNYTFKDKDNKYIAFTSSATSKNNNLWLVDDASTNGATWTVSFNSESSLATIQNVYNTSRTLRGNTTSGQYRICGYTGTSMALLTLYKKNSGPVVTITGISAALKNPSKAFYVGDTVDVSDIEVTVNYSNNTSAVLTNNSGVSITSGANLTTTGSNTVTVKYEHGEDTFTTTLNVTANAARYILSYALTGDMTKKVYTVGEPWNFAGIKLEAVYNVGDNEVLGDLADLITDSSVVNEYDLSVSAPAVGVTSLTIENMVAYGGNDVDPITITGIVVNETSNSSVFDLTTTDNLTSASTNLMAFASGSSTITFEKAGATTNANNYYPGTPNQSYNQTRAYKNSVGTFDAGLGETITTIEFVCHTDSYATALKNSTWTNGTAAVDSTNTKLVVVTATAGSQVVSVTFGGTVGFDTITINHSDYNGPSIQITNAPTDGLQVGATGTLGYEATNATNPTVTWSSSDESVVTINETTGEWSALKLGSATITASITATEGSTSATAKINVTIGGHVSIQEALNIATEIGSGKTTEYTVEVSGYITNLDDDNKGAGNERALRIADAKTGSEVSIMVYGIYSNNALRQYAIIGGYLTVRGNIQNFKGTAEITSPVVVAYEDAAIDFAKTAYASLNEACVNGPAAITSSQWSDLATAFNALTTEEKAKLSAATAENANEDLAKWAARYARCVNYGLSDFMGTGAASNALRTFSNGTVAMIVAISAMSLLAAAIIIRKKQLSK